MTAENRVIKKYQYELHNQFTADGINENVLLYLYDSDKLLLAVVAFLPDGKALASPEETTAGHVAVQMHHRHLSPLIDMLRNEKPVTFSWSDATGVIRISTQKEPVGEQELKRLFAFLYI